ncbi:MAG: ATP-binding protein [Spirochaetota bacterium]
MDNDIYARLAETLDSLPNGFPRSQSGIELQLLRKIFEPDEAGLFCDLKLKKETPAEISRRTGRPVNGLAEKLDSMWWKGQIERHEAGGETRYNLVPWILGIYEYQLRAMDEEMARLHVKYIKSVGPYFLARKPQIMQVVPIEREVSPANEALPFAQVSAILDKSRSFAVNQCICKKQMRLIGKGCDKMQEVCMVLSETEGFFDHHPMGGRVITREEAGEIVRRAEENGLVHMTGNVRDGHVFLCNCCGCCCLQLIAARFGIKDTVNSHYYAVIDPSLCTSCGTCSDRRCQVAAIETADGARKVIRDKCIGCGLCASTCPSGAISIVRKADADMTPPPEDEMDWYRRKAAEQGIDISRFI